MEIQNMKEDTDTTEDKLTNAKAQGQAQFDNIVTLVERLENARENDDGTAEIVEQDIRQDPLSVEVRSDWYVPGAERECRQAGEYRILLCTGGPAVQIHGALSEHGEPESAHLEVQDWFTPWGEFSPVYRNSHNVSTEGWLDDAKARETILLTYAECFCFGE